MTRSSNGIQFLPIGLDLRGAPCLVVGGGTIGTRKVATLERAGAAVAVVAPAISEGIAALVAEGKVRWHRGAFEASLVNGAFLVVAATNDPDVNAAIVPAARDRGALVCDASDAGRSQVAFGALLQRENDTIAVFSGGHDPAHARAVRDRIAQWMSGYAEEEGTEG